MGPYARDLEIAQKKIGLYHMHVHTRSHPSHQPTSNAHNTQDTVRRDDALKPYSCHTWPSFSPRKPHTLGSDASYAPSVFGYGK